jgi:hypothetical protein
MIDVRDDGDISQVTDHIEYSWPRSRQGFAGTGIILGNLYGATVSLLSVGKTAISLSLASDNKLTLQSDG